MSRGARLGPRWVFALLVAIYAGLAVAALGSDSSVADEHPHILSGWLYWESGTFAGGVDNPPLGQLLVAAPYRLLGLDYRFPDDKHLAWARLPVVLLLVALAVLVAGWTTHLHGAWAGIVSLAFLCLEPNLVAHGHLATLDLPLTFFWWAALWQWRAVLRSLNDSEQPQRAAWIGFFVALALAVFTKFTGLFLLPACALVALFALRSTRARARGLLWLMAAALGLLLVSHLLYGFGPTRYGLPQTLVDAIAGKWVHRNEGHFSYLMGRRSVEGFPEYYLVTLLVKTPLPLLALALTGASVAWRRWARVDQALLILPALLLVVVFSFVGVNIGVRHILPVYPALVIAAALGAHVAWRHRVARIVVGVACAAWMVGIARVVPQQLAYFNVIAGGARGGHEWLLDSNLDWGQDDGRLERFLETAKRGGESWQVNPDGRRARTGRFVVNVNTLHNLLRRDTSSYAWLRSMPSAGSAGYAWRCYELNADDFAALATQRPHDVRAQVALAEVLVSRNDWSGAKARYQNAMRAFPRQSRVFQSAIESALEHSDSTAAMRWVEAGMRASPSDAVLRALADRVQMQRIAQESNRADEVARAQASLGLWWASQGDLEGAVRWLSTAAEVLPAEVEVVRALGVAEARRGRFDAAVTVFERPRVESALRAEAQVCRSLARTEESLRMQSSGSATTGLQPRPTRAALMDLATTHFDDQRYDRAAAALTAILRDDPTDHDALALLSEMHVRSKLRIVNEVLTPRSLERHTEPGEPR